MAEKPRQGDILIRKVPNIPKSATKRKDNVILEGEVSGHAHRINYGSVLDFRGRIFLNVPDHATITHEEHNTVELEKGKYEVLRQREAKSSVGSLQDWSYVSD